MTAPSRLGHVMKTRKFEALFMKTYHSWRNYLTERQQHGAQNDGVKKGVGVVSSAAREADVAASLSRVTCQIWRSLQGLDDC